MMALRCPRNASDQPLIGSHAGYIILAEPTGDRSTINNFLGQSMVVRPPSFYENIFKDMDLDIVFREDYPSYPADKTRMIH